MEENPNLSSKLKKALAACGFSSLTEIQKLAIPEIQKGDNIIISAPTGYGKTLCAFIPFLDRINPEERGIDLLYITPLRSLNRDIFKSVIRLANLLGVEVDIRHGDTTAYERANQVRMPPHCLITTPETLQAMLLSKKMIENLKRVKYIVVDEVQSLMESKRGTQFSIGLERIKRLTNVQIVGLSATIADFDTAKGLLGCTKAINFKGNKQYEVEVIYPAIDVEDEDIARSENVSHVTADGLKYIRNEIMNSKSTLIFTNTRETAELLGSRLSKLLKDQKIEVHHSSLSKEIRTEIENKFKIGEINVMIATSSMELGIDIGRVDLVIQYMSPRQVIKLIQRVGRSNHREMGVSKGKILTISIDDYLESLAIDECRKEDRFERAQLPLNSLDILAHQMVGLIIDGVNKPEEMFEILKRTYAYSTLKKGKLNEIIDFLIRHYFIRYYGESLIRTRKGLLFYIQNISSIPEKKTYLVIDKQLNKKIGLLDENFVAENSKPGDNFVMKGETWKVVGVESGKVNVIRAENKIGAIPAWEGELMPVYDFVAQKAAEMRKRFADKFSILTEQKTNFVMPDAKTILIEKIDEFIVIHSTFGNRVNEALAKALATKISEILGESVLSKIDPYRIIIKTVLQPDKLRELLHEIKDVKALVESSIKRSSLYEHRFLNVAKRFGVINRNADITKMRMHTLIDIYKGTILEEETLNEILSEKVDVSTAEAVIKAIDAGDVKISINSGMPSPLAYEGIDSTYGGSLMRPDDAKKAFRQMVLDRLDNTVLALTCMNCGKNIGEMRAGNADGIKCSRCGARYIAFYKTTQKDIYAPVIKKLFGGKKTRGGELKVANALKQSGALYIAYSGRACIVGAAYGIGPKTATKILRNPNMDEEKLIDRIIEAERNYIETKEYWT